MRSDETSEWNEAFDDFDVPVGAHWRLEAIQVYGKAATEHPRTFKVTIARGGGGAYPAIGAPVQLFSERVTVAGGPNYLIPIEGAPVLGDQDNYYPGQYWISVQAVSAGGEDDWSWLTGPDTAGTAPAYLHGYTTYVRGAEPGLAFQLLGSATQTVEASVFGAGTIVSDPPGIYCPGTCFAEFPQGTTLTFTATAATTSVRFTGWGFGGTGHAAPAGALVPAQTPSPCAGTGGCSLTLEHETNVRAVFEPIDEVTVLRVVRDRRTGRGKLLVWAPGEGVLSMTSYGMRSFFPGTVSAGIVRIPLKPTKKVARTLRRRGRARVSAKVDFRAIELHGPGTTHLSVTLVRKRPRAFPRRHH